MAPIHYNVSEADYVAACELVNSRHTREDRLKFGFGLFQLGCLLFGSAVYLKSGVYPGLEDGFQWFYVLYPAAMVLMLTAPLRTRRAYRLHYQDEPALREPFTLLCEEEGLELASHGLTSLLRWSDFVLWRENRQFFVLAQAEEDSLLPIPKAGIDLDTIDRMRFLFGINLDGK